MPRTEYFQENLERFLVCVKNEAVIVVTVSIVPTKHASVHPSIQSIGYHLNRVSRGAAVGIRMDWNELGWDRVD